MVWPRSRIVNNHITFLRPSYLRNFHGSTLNMSYKLLADDNILDKPVLDDRRYRYFKLEKNNLHVLAISDPTTDKSGAALDVHVGSFADSIYQVLGLAHFCEHLLFMGTEKFPEENEYSSYLSKHSGSSNAYTSSEHTNYYFEVGADHLEGAIDRFSQFFIAPLFSKSCKDREIKAVDSENKKNLQNDMWRFYQLDKSTSNPNHPFNGFSTGNYSTLHEDPISRGLNVRDVLMKFHKEQYSSNIMSLVVLGKESLDELSDWCDKYFSDIPDAHLSKPDYNNEVVYREQDLGKLIKAKPIMDFHKLEVSFMVPFDQSENWASKPLGYYSHLLGHESKGSVLYYLKEKKWVNELSSGSFDVCVGSSLFLIEIDLTPKGLENWKLVVATIFQYVNMILQDEPQKYIWEEINNMGQVDFKFTQKGRAANTVSKLSSSLHKFWEDAKIPAQHILSSSISREYNPSKIKELGQYFSVENSRLVLSSQTFDNLDSSERWYGTQYLIDNIPLDLLESIKSIGLNPQLHYPEPNKFIPKDFSISGTKSESPLLHPYLIEDNEKFNVWFKQDDQFEVPKGTIEVRLVSPTANKTAQDATYYVLLSELIQDELNDISYQALVCGLKFDIFTSNNALVVKLAGYNDKLPVLLDQILEKITNFEPSVERYEPIKDKLCQDYKNAGFNVPYIQIGSCFSGLVTDGLYSRKEKLELLNDKITYDGLKSYSRSLWTKGIFGQIFIHGNFSYDRAAKISQLTQSHFKDVEAFVDRETSLNSQILSNSYVLPKGTHARYEVELEDAANINSCIEYFVQLDHGPEDERLRVLVDLLATITHEPCFNQLRTKEQLGYVVFSGVKLTRSKTGFRILVQSERPCDYLEYRIEEFLHKFKEGHLGDSLTDETFEKYKAALKDKKLQKLKNLNEEFDRFKTTILEGQYNFSQRLEHVKILETVTKEELRLFFNEYIDPLNTNSKSAKLKVYLNSQCTPALDANKSLLVALSNTLQSEGHVIASDELEKIAELNNFDLGAITKHLVSEVKTLDDSKAADVTKKVTALQNQPVPSQYPKGVKFDSISEFRKTYNMDPIPEPVQPLAHFHLKHAHL